MLDVDLVDDNVVDGNVDEICEFSLSSIFTPVSSIVNGCKLVSVFLDLPVRSVEASINDSVFTVIYNTKK